MAIFINRQNLTHPADIKSEDEMSDVLQASNERKATHPPRVMKQRGERREHSWDIVGWNGEIWMAQAFYLIPGSHSGQFRVTDKQADTRTTGHAGSQKEGTAVELLPYYYKRRTVTGDQRWEEKNEGTRTRSGNI